MTSSSHNGDAPDRTANITDLTRRDLLTMATAGAAAAVPAASLAAGPRGQLTWAIHVSLAPTWFDPADTQAVITPFMVLYALHDAMVKPMPGNMHAPSLAESWSTSEDYLAYEFVLREGAKFHNGETVTADDVKFSFERYRGASYKLIKDQVAAIEVPDARRVRFQLKKPWPDFLTFYSTASGAGWVVPREYVEKVGDDGFRKHPIGAGPYKFVSFSPGDQLVLEAVEGYWRKPPAVKRLVMKVIPDESTRLAALKGGEVDIAYSIRGELAEELQRLPGLDIKSIVLQGPNWIYFPEQWDPQSPWHDLRVRQAANLAIDREGMSKALFLGKCKITNSIIPDSFEYYWQPPAAVYDPVKAREIIGRGGFSQRFRFRIVLLRQLVREYRRSGGEQFPRGRHSDQAPADRAGRLCRGVRSKEVYPGRAARGERGVRQRGDTACLFRRLRRRQRLWRLSRHRRALPAAGRRAGSEEAGRDPRTDAAAGAREGDFRADLAVGVPQRCRATGW